MVEKHKKGYLATLPTSGPLLILPPALRRRGSPKRRGFSVATSPTSGPILILSYDQSLCVLLPLCV